MISLQLIKSIVQQGMTFLTFLPEHIWDISCFQTIRFLCDIVEKNPDFPHFLKKFLST